MNRDNTQLTAQAKLAYPHRGKGLDEAYSPKGEVRAHWRYLLESLQDLGDQGIEERQHKARRILRDDGATFRIYDHPEADALWQLDPIPLLIRSEEWVQIESALVERAELFNLILRDIYGPRSLITQGIVPPELIYAHPGFLRPCQDTSLQGEHQLILHAADLVRAPDGKINVISDRTQAPSGAGYTLENRTVMSRVFPSLFRDSHVHRLSLFFSHLRQKLQELNPNEGIARIVVLTPGAYNEAYFEHAYLANYLGFHLVQGSDLVVRDGYVWMKSLNGLKRVDVILRRVDDYYCDPLELRGDSQLGVPGLLQVARTGRVAIANPLGAGVLENPAWLSYLPAVSRHLLGRELQLPSVQTWWCGNPADEEYVCDNLDHLLIKPTFRRPGIYEVYGAELDNKKRQAWINRIRKNPLNYVGQAFIPCTNTPTWLEGQIQPRPAILRTFSVASKQSWAVLPGGLTRVNLDPGKKSITNQGGSISKDTWVLASEPEKQLTLRTTDQKKRREITTELPSRVAENLFWMGRNAERAESALRLMRTVFIQLNKSEALPEIARLTLLRTITHVTYTYPGFSKDDPSLLNHPEQEMLAVVLDQSRPGSVACSLYAMINAAEEVRDQLSNDTQRVINDIGDEMAQLYKVLSPKSAPEEALDPLVTALLALAGLIQESMVRGHGWRFLEIGRRIERALQLSSLLRSLLVPVHNDLEEEILTETALLCGEVLIPYHRRYPDGINIENGIEMLMHNGNNPRSLIYQLAQLEPHLGTLPGGQEMNQARKLLLEADTALRLSDSTRLAYGEGIRADLDQLLARLQNLLSNTAKAVSQKYFDHTESPQLLVKSNQWQDNP